MPRPTTMARALLWAATLGLATLGGATSRADDTSLQKARILFSRGMDEYQAGKLNDAAEHMREAWALAPLPELAYNLGRVYERMGERTQSAEFYERYLASGKATAAERKDIAARLANLRAREERWLASVRTAPPSGTELTAEARAFFTRGVSLFQRKKYAAALEAFRASIQFVRAPDIFFNMGLTAERLGEPAQAAEYYHEYLRAKPSASDRDAVKAHMAKLRGAQDESRRPTSPPARPTRHRPRSRGSDLQGPENPPADR